MKKFTAVAMIALLAVTSVFAGFSGEFSADYTADFANEVYGFNNGAGFKMTFDATTGSTANEEDVYAKLVGEFSIKDLKANGALNGAFKLKEASINGADWSIDLTGAAGVANYANGFAGRTDDGIAPVLANKVDTAAGITGAYKGYTASVGMTFKPATEVSYKKITINSVEGKPQLYEKQADGSFKAVVVEGYPTEAVKGKEYYVVDKKAGEASKALSAAFALPEYKFVEDKLSVTGSVGAFATSTKAVDLGLGAKVAYADEALSASVGADVVLNIADEVKVDADVLAKVAYAPVDVAVYFATNAASYKDDAPVYSAKNLLDVKVATDLKSFEIPVSFAITGTDLINDNRGIDASVAVAVAGANINVNGGYNFGLKNWNAGVSADYTLENVAKFAANVGLKGVEKLDEVSFGVSAENSTLIENATLKLAYASANFLAKDKAAGALTASVGIEF